MPKLSQAKRHRKQFNLAACCHHAGPLLETPRKVSEEDMGKREEPAKHSLKRPNPSGCLTDLLLMSGTSAEDKEAPRLAASPSPCPLTETTAALTEENDDSCISPIWGHFVDVILDQEKEDPLSSASSLPPNIRTPLVAHEQHHLQPMHQTLPHPTGGEHSHHPYNFLARANKKQKKERRRITSSSPDRLKGFVLEDPASLQEALSRMKV